MKRLELPLYVLVLVFLGGLLLMDGKKAAALEAQSPVSPKELLSLLSNPKLRVQVVDLRAHDDDHFIDSHIPGAISVPGCNLDSAPAGAKEHVYPYVTTILVSEEGDKASFDTCRSHFKMARNLLGGMVAWSATNLPEDTGAYRPPKASASGGCL